MSTASSGNAVSNQGYAVQSQPVQQGVTEVQEILQVISDLTMMLSVTKAGIASGSPVAAAAFVQLGLSIDVWTTQMQSALAADAQAMQETLDSYEANERSTSAEMGQVRSRLDQAPPATPPDPSAGPPRLTTDVPETPVTGFAGGTGFSGGMTNLGNWGAGVGGPADRATLTPSLTATPVNGTATTVQDLGNWGAGLGAPADRATLTPSLTATPVNGTAVQVSGLTAWADGTAGSRQRSTEGSTL